jgi:Domain of unknown function (DUF4365)
MTEEQQKEQFSIAYVRAVAAASAVNVYQPEVDDDSVDIGFCARIAKDRAQRPRLEAQLKCTAVLEDTDDTYRFPLKVKNYNDLRGDDVVPRVLILVTVPVNVAAWLTLTTEQLVLRKSAFWVSLTGLPATTNIATVTVPVPKRQLFDVASLRQLLDQGVSP